MKFSQRAESITPFLAMSYGDKADALAKQGHRVVRLNLGEPDFGAPSEVMQALTRLANGPALSYTSALGLPELRQAIANFYLSQHGIAISAERVVVTAGASAALLLISAALVNPEDEVILGDPSYPCNRRFIASFGGKVSLVPTPASQHFQLKLSDVKRAWNENTKGVLIASPANPTGTSIAQQELKAICDFCQQQNAWRIIDEIYLDLYFSPQSRPQSALAIDDKAIVINSFSKYFGMTGWRLGWCIVPEPMVAVVDKLAQNLFICPPTLSQYAALACFTEPSLAECEQRRASLLERKNQVVDAIEKMGLTIEAMPDGAFYLYINICASGLSAIEFCDRLLYQYHVALTPGNDFGEYQAEQYVRLSFATNEDDLQLGLARMAQMLNSLNQQ